MNHRFQGWQTTPTAPKVKAFEMSTKVAIVEDDAGFRGLLEQFVNDAPGYRCAGTFGSAEDALRGIPKVEPDVVLMDIHLPNLSGIEATHRLRELLPKTPVLMLTVNTDTDSIFKALKAGAKGYLLKRTAPQKLLPAIEEALSGGSPMTGEIARQVVEFFQQNYEVNRPELDLSRREREVLELLAQGYIDKEIATRLHVGYDTVRTHCSHIFEKLQVRSRAGAVAKFLNRSGGRQPVAR
jgi:DNA-binding NarL/FixJ family response regulator